MKDKSIIVKGKGGRENEDLLMARPSLTRYMRATLRPGGGKQVFLRITRRGKDLLDERLVIARIAQNTREN